MDGIDSVYRFPSTALHHPEQPISPRNNKGTVCVLPPKPDGKSAVAGI